MLNRNIGAVVYDDFGNATEYDAAIKTTVPADDFYQADPILSPPNPGYGWDEVLTDVYLEPIKEPVLYKNYSYSGWVVDPAGNGIPGATVLLYYNGQQIAGTAADNSGSFVVTSTTEPEGILISSAGYITAKFPADVNKNLYYLQRDYKDLDPVTIPNKKNYSWLLLLLLIPMMEKKKKVGKFDNSTLLTIGLAFALFKGMGLITDLLNSLGLGTGSEGHDQSDPGSPWKPAFIQNIPAGTTYKALTVAAGTEYAYDIYHAFTLFYDDFEAIQGIFSQLRTQSQVSSLATYFYAAYKIDLLTFLTNGGGILPWDGLSKSHMKTLIDYVNKLPKYMP